MTNLTQLTEKQKQQQGFEYDPGDSQLSADRLKAKQLCQKFNNLPANAKKAKRQALLELLGEASTLWIEPNFYCDYGYNIKAGKNFYANHNVVILDGAQVIFGDNVLIAPGVLISTATHPLDPDKRRAGIEIAKPISIGNNVWLGMGAKILPGVNIGENAVVAAGAVVSKDVPPSVVVAGVPATVMKDINDN
jgi:maltose O-acetyltransferase